MPLIYGSAAVLVVAGLGLCGLPGVAMMVGAVLYAAPLLFTGSRYITVSDLRARSFGAALGLAYLLTAAEALVDLTAPIARPEVRFWLTSAISTAIALLGLLGILRRFERPAVSGFAAQAGVEAALLGTMFSIIGWRWLFMPLGGWEASSGYPMVWTNVGADFLLLGLAVVVLALDLDRGAFYLSFGIMGGLLADVWGMYAMVAGIPTWPARLLGIPAMVLLVYGAELLSARRPITEEDALAGFERRRHGVLVLLVVAMLVALSHTLLVPEFDVVTVALVAVFVILLGIRDTVQVMRSRFMLEQLQQAATKDPLTGLLNRRALAEDLSRIVDEPGVSVLVIDLDRFKVVNDLAGHAVGDIVLQAVAKALNCTVDPMRGNAYRLGGDDFAVVARVRPEVGERLARDLVKEVTRAAAKVAVAAEMHLGCSIGVHHLVRPKPAEIADALVQAGHAMRAAKSKGRGRVHVFDDSLQDGFRRRQAVESKLGNALHDVTLAYQPIIHLPSGTVGGVEALARWTDPEFGFVSPEEFIDIAEQSSLVVELGDILLDRALREMSDLGCVSHGMSVSVNVSPLQLLVPSFPEKVLTLLARYDVPAHLLILEVTESRLVTPDGLASEAMRRLRAAGIGIAVDDFGAGHTSVGYLPRLAITSVKLDRSLTAGVGQSSSEAVLRGVNFMSASLGLDVVMEGIESIEQVELARELDVKFLQGYFYSRPVPPTELQSVVESINHQARSARV